MRTTVVTVILGLSVLCARPAMAQVEITPPAVPVILDWLASDSMDTQGRIMVFWFLTEDDPRVTPARLDSIVEGLEQLALTGASTAIRQGGVSWLIQAHRRRAMKVLPRLVRIFEGSEDGAVKLSVVDGLPCLVDRPAAAALLGRIAAGGTGDLDRVRHDIALAALNMLHIMGEAGARTLRALHREGSVEAPRARSFLEDLARRGFPLSEFQPRC